MRAFIIAVLFLPSACLALGADAEMFVGVAQTGKVIKIEYVSDRQPWSPGEFIYGSASSAKFRYCWTSGEGSDPSRWYLACTSKKGETPSVFYSHGQYRLHGPNSGIRYKEAMASFAKFKYDKDALLDYYICNKGCNETMPKFLFEVGFGGM